MKTGYYLKDFMPETMKLLGSTKRKITKCKYDENVSHSKITDVILVQPSIQGFNILKYGLRIKVLSL